MWYTEHTMRTAYALLGLTFLIIFAAAYLVIERAHAPSQSDLLVPSSDNETAMLALTSPAFAHNGAIPTRYTCEGENTSPELRIEGVPEGTASLVLVVTDPDIPESVKNSLGISVFDHWVLFNIPPETRVIGEGETPGVAGSGTRSAAYAGPCPPDGEHRYLFDLYALDAMLPLSPGSSKAEVLDALEGHVFEHAQLIGRYEKQND